MPICRGLPASGWSTSPKTRFLGVDSYSARSGPGALISRLAGGVRIAPEGAWIPFGVAVAGLVFLLLGPYWLGASMMGLAVVIALFFRDPDRVCERSEGVALSGADGKVCDIGEAALPGSSGERYHRVSVFMSPLDVHVNRAPVGGEVVRIEHTRGRFRAAFRDDTSEHNERNLVELSDAGGQRHVMVQIAGYFARRIVCRVRVRDRIQVGQRVGLIMFGSRVDHFLPPGYRISVTLGQRVRAGRTIIGELQR